MIPEAGTVSPFFVLGALMVPLYKQNSHFKVIVLCDPPIGKVFELNTRQASKTYPGVPYQGGYLDFLPRKSFVQTPIQGPPRTSMLDDLSFYITEVSTMQGPSGAFTLDSIHIDSSRLVAILMQKLVASEYMKLLDYFEGVLRKLRDSEWRLAGEGDYPDPRRRAAQEQWGSLHVCSHRLGEHIDDVEAILITLNLPLLPPAPLLESESWTESNRDFQYIYHRLQTLKARTDHLVTSTIGMAGIVGNKQALREAELSLKEARRSIREAKSVKTLTIIAMFFIPLAWTSGLFSMSEKYTPGAKYFWVYFIVSLPLVLVVFAAAGMMQMGYDDTAVWSFKTLKETFATFRKQKVVEGKLPSSLSQRAATISVTQPL
jgi:hypothetical protein